MPGGALLLLLLLSTTARAADFQVNSATAGNQAYPSACVGADGRAVVAWESRPNDGTGAAIVARRVGADGLPLGGEIAIDAAGGDRQAPAVACAADGGFMVVWERRGDGADDFDIAARRLAAAGSLGAALAVNDEAAGRQRFADVCRGPGATSVVVWQGDGPDDNDIFARRFDGDAPLGPQRRLNVFVAGDQQHPAVACFADGAYVVAWESDPLDGDGSGIAARRVGADDVAGLEVWAHVTAAGHQRQPDLAALADGGVLVVWESEGQDGDESGIYARRLASDMKAASDEFRVNACAAYSQEQPSVVAHRGGATVAWSSPGDGDGYGIFVRQFDARGEPSGPERLLNLNTAGTQGAVSDEGGGLSAAGNDTGAVLVAWQSLRLRGEQSDGDGAGIFAARATAPTPACAGDCDGDGVVAIDELVRGVALALADAPASPCAALDADGDDRVVVNELIAAVAAALAGCADAATAANGAR